MENEENLQITLIYYNMKMAQWMLSFATLTTVDDKAVNVTNLHNSHCIVLVLPVEKYENLTVTQHFNVRFLLITNSGNTETETEWI